MSFANTRPTIKDLCEASQQVLNLQNWLDSHELSPELAQARVDRIRELTRWQSYLKKLIRERRQK